MVKACLGMPYPHSMSKLNFKIDNLPAILSISALLYNPLRKEPEVLYR